MGGQGLGVLPSVGRQCAPTRVSVAAELGEGGKYQVKPEETNEKRPNPVSLTSAESEPPYTKPL